MRPVSINFTWRKRRAVFFAGIGVLALCLTIAGAVGWLAWQQRQALDAKETEWKSIQQSRQRASESSRQALTKEDRDRQRQTLRVAQSVIERLDTPWDLLFSAVESAFEDQVTLLNVEPDPDRREVRIAAEAKDILAMQAYVRQLRQAPSLRDVYLASHQVNQQDPLHPVRFVANARWITPSSDRLLDAGANREMGSDLREELPAATASSAGKGEAQ